MCTPHTQIYLYTQINRHKRTHSYNHTRVHTHRLTHSHSNSHLHILHTLSHTYIHAYSQTRTHSHMHTLMFTYIYIYKNSHTQIHTLSLSDTHGHQHIRCLIKKSVYSICTTIDFSAVRFSFYYYYYFDHYLTIFFSCKLTSMDNVTSKHKNLYPEVLSSWILKMVGSIAESFRFESYELF